MRPIVSVLTLLTLFFLFSANPTAAETASQKKEKNRIVVTADKLISENQGRNAEFSGNVRVTQGKTVIRANRLKVFFGSDGAGSESIEKIVARENVRIDFDDKEARSESAVYVIADRKLVLEGGNAQIKSGDNVIRGTKITLYRDEDRIQVEGGGPKRVEAVFYTQGDVLE